MFDGIFIFFINYWKEMNEPDARDFMAHWHGFFKLGQLYYIYMSLRELITFVWPVVENTKNTHRSLEDDYARYTWTILNWYVNLNSRVFIFTIFFLFFYKQKLKTLFIFSFFLVIIFYQLCNLFFAYLFWIIYTVNFDNNKEKKFSWIYFLSIFD